ncbi:MAG: protoheme IX farnesyltransferase [Acidobacteria bacterium]|nr:MAG: protoheme IX farnesyltransferase [Acidobacteriota bacterium]
MRGRASEAEPALDADRQPRDASVIDRVKAYVTLTKPRIILLLLVTTVPAMVLAEGSMPSGWLILATLLGGSLAAGGANAVNCYVDRDIDLKMDRTASRPIPSGAVSAGGALIFGLALGLAGFAFLATTVNLLTALLATGALGFYVLVYTLVLKRHTSLNIVIGGAAGAVPVLCGWAAVTGSLGWPAVVLFLIVFLWTPPHFWALAIKYTEDYRAAGVPMLPVTRGVKGTARSILIYAAQMIVATLILVPVSGMGIIYLVAALALGALFMSRALQLFRNETVESAMKLFTYSITYLFVLFVAIAADVIVRNFGA